MPDISTSYMGLHLKNPLIVGSCGLTGKDPDPPGAGGRRGRCRGSQVDLRGGDRGRIRERARGGQAQGHEPGVLRLLRLPGQERSGFLLRGAGPPGEKEPVHPRHREHQLHLHARVGILRKGPPGRGRRWPRAEHVLPALRHQAHERGDGRRSTSSSSSAC